MLREILDAWLREEGEVSTMLDEREELKREIERLQGSIAEDDRVLGEFPGGPAGLSQALVERKARRDSAHRDLTWAREKLARLDALIQNQQLIEANVRMADASETAARASADAAQAAKRAAMWTAVAALLAAVAAGTQVWQAFSPTSSRPAAVANGSSSGR